MPDSEPKSNVPNDPDPNATPKDSGTPPADPKQGGKDPTDQPYFTKGMMTSLMAARDRKLKTQFDSLTSAQSELITSLEEIKKALEPKDPQAGKPDKKVSPELLDLQKKVESLTKVVQDRENKIAELESKGLANRKKSVTTSALTKAGCFADQVEVAYDAIERRIEYDADGDRFFVKHEENGMEVELPIEKFVTDVVRETVIPYIFKGTNRAGGPTPGDMNVRTGPEMIREEDLTPEYYRANQEKVDAAIDKGQIIPARH